MTVEDIAHRPPGYDLEFDGVKREVLLTSQQIQERVDELGARISEDYRGKKPLLVGVLKGAFVTLADLSRSIDPSIEPEFAFMAVSSYEDGQKSSKNPRIRLDLNIDIEDRHVLLVEDILETGYSLDRLKDMLGTRNPASLETLVMFRKPDDVRERSINPRYVGFDIPPVWVEGYGLDTAESNRGLPDLVYRVETGNEGAAELVTIPNE